MKQPVTERGGLAKATFRLFKDDIEYLKKRFPRNQASSVRDIIHNWIVRDKGRNK